MKKLEKRIKKYENRENLKNVIVEDPCDIFDESLEDEWSKVCWDQLSVFIILKNVTYIFRIIIIFITSFFITYFLEVKRNYINLSFIKLLFIQIQ